MTECNSRVIRISEPLQIPPNFCVSAGSISGNTVFLLEIRGGNKALSVQNCFVIYLLSTDRTQSVNLNSFTCTFIQSKCLSSQGSFHQIRDNSNCIYFYFPPRVRQTLQTALDSANLVTSLSLPLSMCSVACCFTLPCPILLLFM